MSDGSNTSIKVLLEPLRSIGKIKFVVISQGCVYCYNSGESRRPNSAFSLYIYDSVRRYSSNYVQNCLEIVQEDGKASHVFGFETEDSLNEWMSVLKEEMELAHIDSPKCSAESVDSGIDGMKPSTRPRVALPSLPEVPKPGKETRYKPANSEYEVEPEEEEESPYDEVVIMETVKPTDQADGRKPIALPTAKPKIPPQRGNSGATSGVTAGATSGPTRKLPAGAVSCMPGSSIPGPPVKTVPGPLVKTKPMGLGRDRTSQGYSPVMMPPPGKAPHVPEYINEIFQRDTYYFDSSDREEAERLLRRTPEGTFLVRKSRSSSDDVLCVHTPHGYKEFKLTTKDGKLTLNNNTMFPSLDALLSYHSQNPLPKSEYTIKLISGYNT